MAVAQSNEDELGLKLTSKMTVAALLAGFNFAALLELVKEPGKLQFEGLLTLQAHWPPTLTKESVFPLFSIAAIIFLTISMGLFVAAIYIYDSLSMPKNFLESARDKPILARASKEMERRLGRFGPVYATMIYTWQFVFMPAVTFAVLGFLCIVARGSFLLAGGAIFVFVGIGFYYCLVKPRYSVE